MNIVFFTNDDFAINSLKKLTNSKHKILACITDTPKKKGRGLNKYSNIYQQYFNDKNLNIIEHDDLNDPTFISHLKKMSADVYIVIAYKIIPKKIFSIPPKGTINLHASILPEYRGAAPIQRTLMNNSNNAGVTTFIINEQIDDGDIIIQKSIEIDDKIKYNKLSELLSILGSNILMESLNLISSDNVKYIKQGKCIKYANKIKKNEYKIDFNNNSLKIHNKIRALTGPGCYTYYKQKRVKLLDTYYSNDNAYNLSLGEFKFDKDNVIIIGCRMGILLVYKLQFSGKNPITSKEFHNQNISSYFFECNE